MKNLFLFITLCLFITTCTPTKKSREGKFYVSNKISDDLLDSMNKMVAWVNPPILFERRGNGNVNYAYLLNDALLMYLQKKDGLHIISHTYKKLDSVPANTENFDILLPKQQTEILNETVSEALKSKAKPRDVNNGATYIASKGHFKVIEHPILSQKYMNLFSDIGALICGDGNGKIEDAEVRAQRNLRIDSFYAPFNKWLYGFGYINECQAEEAFMLRRNFSFGIVEIILLKKQQRYWQIQFFSIGKINERDTANFEIKREVYNPKLGIIEHEAVRESDSFEIDNKWMADFKNYLNESSFYRSDLCCRQEYYQGEWVQYTLYHYKNGKTYQKYCSNPPENLAISKLVERLIDKCKLESEN